MNILVGSANPVKISAVKAAFSRFFKDIEVTAFLVNSRVSDQPLNDETFTGAYNRAQALKDIDRERQLDAHFFVGLEGGIIQYISRWFVFGAICIIDSTDMVAFGTTPHFEIPGNLVERLSSGMELGEVIDDLKGVSNTKPRDGAIGFFTKGVLTRKDIYVTGLISALVPFLNRDIYMPSGGGPS
ncbi:MAG: inosine/xanthosine triphosphatase [Thermodesulfobacteriota bacterium]